MDTIILYVLFDLFNCIIQYEACFLNLQVTIGTLFLKRMRMWLVYLFEIDTVIVMDIVQSKGDSDIKSNTEHCYWLIRYIPINLSPLPATIP